MLNKVKHKTRLTQNSKAKHTSYANKNKKRERKEIPNDVKLLTLHFCYVKAYICHFMIGGQQ